VSLLPWKSHWYREAIQKLMTRIANRTFKQKPNLLDRMAIRLIEQTYGPVTEDPELEHS
jgi:hypothetical protein